MYKVMTILGTRPEIIRLSRVIEKFDQLFNHILVFTGQNYDPNLSVRFFSEMEIRAPDHALNLGNTNPYEFLSDLFKSIGELLKIHQPDVVVILGDTNSGLAAIVAKKLGYPILHIEAGNRSFDKRVPEELNRRIIDGIADLNIAYSTNSKTYLMQEGLRGDSVVVLGSPLGEVAKFYKDKILSSTIVKKLNQRKDEYILVSLHRSELINRPTFIAWFEELISNLRHRLGLNIVCSLHPHTEKLLAGRLFNDENVFYHSPFGYFDYVNLQMNSAFVISDSGTITEEASIFGFSAVCARDYHERPEGDDLGIVVHAGTTVEGVMEAARILLISANSCRNKNESIELAKRRLAEELYFSPDFSDRLAKNLIRTITRLNKNICSL